ncbi:hypothetical protein CVIRNUC_009999 [Coccomyxa viridis]|uniref:Uncharacterized protein n=1 Tax=Coccomyxa viridis TaxID=1274662 RepID=A0AAV1IL60_9CHLO|nr:hypothetical protein CVIRNUC_009999 [Coccomyxa viridis]
MHKGRRPARLLAVACLVAGALAQTQTPPDPLIFAPVQIAGDLGTGFPAYYVGCTGNGATLQDIIVFANDNFLRGIEVNLTDGRLVQFGCVNTTSAQTGCILGQLDVGIRTASFRFAPGERVTQMALFAGPDDKGNPNRRAGAIRFATSMGRFFDFGNKKARDQPLDVDVASGVPCGVAARRGADIDAVGFVFLQNISAGTLYDVQYSGIPTDQANSSAFNASYSSTQLQNVTYDNSNSSEAHTYTYASEFSQVRPSVWSHGIGLDSYSTDNVTGGIPQLITSNTSKDPQGWQVSLEGHHQRTDNNLQADQWSYNIPVPGGAIYTAQVSLLQGKIAVPYSGNMSLLLATGSNVTVPVQGTYTGTTYAPAKVDINVIKPGNAPASVSGTTVQSSAGSSQPGGGNHGWAIAVGVILGVLLLALIVAALFLVRRRQRRKQFQANSKANHLGTYPGDASHANPNGAAAAASVGAGAGAGAGLAGRMPSFKNKKPNTPRATQAQPGAADEAPSGMWRMMPAGVMAQRFQQLFKGKGHGEEDLNTAERGLSTTSTHSQAPEIPLSHDPSPTKGAAGAGAAPSGAGPRAPTAPFEANVAAVNQASQAEAPQGAPGSGRPLGRLGSNMSTVSGVSGVEAGAPAHKRKGSIEHEGTPIKLGSGRSRSGIARKLSQSEPSRPPRPAQESIAHDNANISLGRNDYTGPN